MLHRLLGEIPFWLQSDQIAMRQELARVQPVRTRRQRRVSLLRTALGLTALLLFSYLAATYGQTMTNGLEAGWRTLWTASLVLQMLIVAPVVLSFRRGTQDSVLKATPHGIRLWVRARWMGGILRARVLLWLLVLLRVGMIGLFLLELTAMRGAYLDLTVSLQMSPPLPLGLAYGLVALGLTVALLLPLLTTAFDSLVGQVASDILRERTFALVYQLGWIMMRWGSMAASVWLYDRVMQGDILIARDSEPILYGTMALLGDQGATFTHLTRLGAAWARTPEVIWLPVLGVALLLGYGLLLELGWWVLQRRAERAD